MDKTEKLEGTAPRKKLRGGQHMPTRRERDRKNDYKRSVKHRSRETAEGQRSE